MTKSSLKKATLKVDKLEIKKLINCVSDGEKIESRKGFYTRPEDYVFKSDGTEAFDMSLVITDCYLFLDGKYGRVAVTVADNLMDSITYNMMLLCTDKTTIPLGKISFSTSGGAMGFPDTFAVFRGRENQGSGVYFISRRLYDDELPDMISVRELSSDRESWILLTESLIYTPLILANGRGEAYHSAEVSGRALSLPTPILFESKNMLNPRFKAAYTTDGASAGFSLPYSQIDNTSVVAELFYKGEKHTLQITGTAVKSSAVLIDSAEVVMNVDRAEGRIFFTNSSGAYWTPEFTGSVNNLCITAYKTVSDHIKKVGAMSASRTIEGNVSLLYKSATEPSSVAVNSIVDPLYFPENTAFLLGYADTKVESILEVSGNLFAFKEGEIYSAAVKSHKPNKKSVSLLGSLRETDEYTLSFKKACSLKAEAIPETIKELNGELLFQTRRGEVWKIKVSGGSNLSPERIETLNETFNFALAEKDRYILIKDDRAAVFEKTKSGYITGEWTLPEKAVGGFSYIGKAIFFFSCYKEGVYMIYASDYGWEKDIKFISQYETEECDISSCLGVATAGNSDSARRINKITVLGAGKELNLSLVKSEKTVLQRRSRFKDDLAEFYMGANIKNGYMELSFCNPTVIEGVSALYRPIGIIKK